MPVASFAPAGRDRIVGRVLDLSERAAIAIGVGLFYAANYASHRPINLLIVASDALTLWFILFRRPAVMISRRGEDWLAAMVGTFAPLFMRPGGAPLIAPAIATGLVISGVSLTLWAKLRLNRSFGIAPANRGVQVRGPYALVRHPMYLGYLVVQAAYALLNPTNLNAALLAVGLAGQFARVFLEERLLGLDPTYRAYAQQVRFRLVPGVF